MDQHLRLRLEQDAEAGNRVAERLLLNAWLGEGNTGAIESLLERYVARGQELEARFLEAELVRFHAWPSESPWQSLLERCCAENHKEALFVGSVYHYWAGMTAAAATLGSRVSDPSTEAQPGAEPFAGGWDDWTPPNWRVVIDAKGVTVSQSTVFAPAFLLGFVRSLLAPQLRPSAVVDPQSGKTIAHPVRINQSAQWHPEQLGWVGKLFECRLAEACGYDVGNGEVLSLLHYRPGQRYKAHLDCIGTKQAESPDGLAEGGQRTMTVLLTLGDPDLVGGETNFPKLEASARAGIGELLRFNNTDADDRPLSASLHEGSPVQAGQKWLLSKWVRKLPTPYGREICLGRRSTPATAVTIPPG